MKILLKLGSIVLLLLFITISNAKAQVVLNESFDNTTFLPTGWSAAPNGAPNNLWTRQTAGTFPACSTHSGAGMARYNSRTSTIGSTQTIATPAFSLSTIGANVAHVSFWIFRNDTLPTAYDTLNVMVNTALDTVGAVNLGTFARSRQISLPDTQSTDGWFHYSVNIPNSFNGNTNYILFRGVTQSGGGTGYRIFIDDVSWDSYPALCTGVPNAGTITSNDTLICGGSGSANLTLTDSSSGFSGITYLWEYASVAGGPFSSFGTNTTTQNTGTITSTTYYRCIVKCTASGDSSITPVFEIRISPNAGPNVTVTPNSPIYCVNSGSIPMLVASGATTYIWTPAQGLSATDNDTVFANPTNSTNYVVTGFNSFGCYDTAMVRVAVHQTPTVTVTPTSLTSCLNDSITLTATSSISGFGNTITYTWLPGSYSGPTVTVPVDSTTHFYVFGVTNFGCAGPQSTDTALVTALLTPVAGTIVTSDTVICGGIGTTNLTLSSNSTTGSTISYNWLFSSNANGPWTSMALDTNAITTDTLAARTYFICVVSCGTNNSDTTLVQSINVSPNGNPVVSVTPTVANHCINASASLLVGSGAQFYSWAPANGLSSTTADSVYASPTNSTTYILTGYDSFGCRDTATVRVTNRQIPTVSVNLLTATICDGDSLVLNASSSGVPLNTTVTYTWMPGLLTGSSITVAPGTSTDYIVTGVTNFGCSSDISVDTSVVIVNQLTHANFSYSILNLMAAFTNSSMNATSYLWNFGNGDTSILSSPNYSYTAIGTYPITLIATGLCNSDTISDTLHIITDGLINLAEKEVQVFPNPSRDFIKVEYSNKVKLIEVLDVLGNVLISKSVSNSYSQIIDIRNLSAGNYFLRIISDDSNKVIQLLKN